MKREEAYVGIDVGRARVDVAIRPMGDIWSLDNDEHGMSELVSRLQTVEPIGEGLNVTGCLGVPLVSALPASPWA